MQRDLQPAPRRRKYAPRQPYSCTECTRRKVRCSKVIPCSACIDAGFEHLCHRESINATRQPSVRAQNNKWITPYNTDWYTSQESSETTVASDASVARNLAPLPGQHQTPLASQEEISLTEVTNRNLPVTRPAGSLIEGVAQDAALSLEYLALGRQYVMQNGNRTTTTSVEGPQVSDSTVDPVVPVEQARLLIAYHGDNLAWMHNILHMPTFREQFEYFFQHGKPIDRFWLPLYYTTLSVTLSSAFWREVHRTNIYFFPLQMTIHLTRPDVLLGFGIDNPRMCIN